MTQDLASQGSRGFPDQSADPTAQVIVVGLDGSPASWDAFCRAAGQATRTRGSLIAVYVTSAVAPVPVRGDFAYAEQAAQEVAAELKAEAEQGAAEAGVQLTWRGNTLPGGVGRRRRFTISTWPSPHTPIRSPATPGPR